jgi:hypothetical protein
MREGGVTAAELTRLDTFMNTSGFNLSPRTRAVLSAAIARGPNVRPAAPPARDINYEALLADGRLELSFAFGFDEEGYHEDVIEAFESSLERRGFVLIDPFSRGESGPRYSRASLLSLGINPDTLDRNVRYYAHVDAAGHPAPLPGLSAPISVRVLRPAASDATLEARLSLGASLRQLFITSEVFAYSGHGRYGSGPDLDAIDSPHGNLRFGTPYEGGHVKLGPPAIPSREMRRPGYQLALFSGCNTDLYVAPLRSAGLSRRERDLIVTNQLNFFERANHELDAFFDAITFRDSLAGTIERLNVAADDDAYHADGFGNLRANVIPPG